MAGVGHLDIGEGLGSAKVFNPSPAIQQYGQILAQKQAKRDAENKSLAEDLARGYDPSGLRNDADRTNYIKKYNDIKQSAIDAQNENDKTQRALKQAQVRQQLNDLGSYAESSKKQGVMERQLAMAIREHPHMFSDDAVKQVQDGLQKEWNDNGVAKSPLDLARGVDPEKVLASYKKMRQEALSSYSGTYDNGVVGPWQTAGGKRFQTVTQNRLMPAAGDNGALEHAMAWASHDDDAKLMLQQTYPNVQGNSPQSTLALRALKFMHDNGDDKGFYDKPKERDVFEREPERPLRWSLEAQEFKRRYGHYPATGEGAGTNATAIIAENMRNSDPVKFKGIIASALPKEGWKDGKGEPEITTGVDDKGQPVHVFKFPDKVKTDPTAIKSNQALRAAYDKKPDYEGGFVGIGHKKVPFEKSSKYKLLLPETKTVKDNSKPYEIPTSDPQAYGLAVADMLKEQGASDATIQHILGKSGVNPVKLGDKPKTGDYTHTQQATDSKGNVVTLGYKNGKWYNTKNNQPVE